jgi:CubicO group peptidase (beta-lactamase class C family)
MPPNSPGLPDPRSLAEALAYFDRYLAFQQRLHRVPGVQAAALAGGELVLSTAHGHADVENDVALTPRHIFRIASHSKTFTATLIMRLVQAGKLRLDDTAAQWVDFLAGSPLGRATVRELLAHSSGVIRDGADADFWSFERSFPGRDELRAMLLDAGASVIARNERFKYSNVGFSLLGLLAEAVEGAPYDELARREIVEPLGLTRTGPDYDDARPAEDYVVGYTSLAYADRRAPVDQAPTGAFAPATGFYSTAEDLVAFFSAHFLGDERLLSDEVKREMQHPLWETAEDAERYGLGLIVSKVGERTLVGHSGGWIGQITYSAADAAAGLALSVLTNANGAPAAALAQAGLHLIDLAGAQPRPEPATDLERFSGRFVNLFIVIDIAVLGGRLYWLAPGDADPTKNAVPLEVLDDHTLRAVGGPGYLSYGEPMPFTFDDQGRARTVRAIAGTTSIREEDFVLPERISLRSEVPA